MATFLRLRFLNWEKFNPKRDQKTYTWLRLDHSFITDPKFHGLSATQKYAIICMLIECSKHNSDTILVSQEWIASTSGCTSAQVGELIDHLVTLEVLEIIKGSATARGRRRSQTSRSTTPTNERTNRRTNKQTNVQTNEDCEGVADAHPVAAPKEAATPILESDTPVARTWRAYREAFEKRHGSPPPWNAKMAGQFRSLTKRMPQDDAPEVARFYVMSNDAYCLKARHPLGLLLRDAERWHVDWSSGRSITTAEARDVELKQHNVNVWGALAARYESNEGETSNGNDG